MGPSREGARAPAERLRALLDEIAAIAGAAVASRIDEARAEITRLEEGSRELYQRTPAMMYSLDPTMRIVTVSDRFAQALGYAREELIGRSVLELITEPSRRFAVEVGRAIILEQGFIADLPYQYVKKSGEVMDALLSSVVLRGEDGELTGLLSVIVDVTERLRAEQALRESEERYRHLFELAPVAIVVHRDGRILFANSAAARMRGVADPTSLIGGSILDVVHPDDHPVAIARMRAAAEAGIEAPAIEETFVRVDGTTYTAEVVNRPIVFQGEPAVQVIYADVSGRKAAAEAQRLAEAQEQVIRAQEELLLSLSAPLIPLGDGLLVVPLVGRITSERAGRLVEALTEGVAAHGARAAILDVTGVPAADNAVAEALARAARAIRLLGAEVVLTGIQPAMAQALVEMGLDLGGIATRGTLRDGIEHARRRRLTPRSSSPC